MAGKGGYAVRIGERSAEMRPNFTCFVTAHLHTKRLLQCLIDGTRPMLESKAGPGVVVRTGGWKSCGLGYRDFAVLVFGVGVDHFDVARMNFDGARKVTRVLSRLIVKAVVHDQRRAVLRRGLDMRAGRR